MKTEEELKRQSDKMRVVDRFKYVPEVGQDGNG